MEESKFVLYMKRKTALAYGISEIERIIAAAPQNKWFTVVGDDTADSFWQQACMHHACAYRTTPLRRNNDLEKIKYSYYYNDDMNYRALYRLDERV